jgi:hypothetical protein
MWWSRQCVLSRIIATKLQSSVTGPALLLLRYRENTKSWEHPTGLRNATNALYVNRYTYISLFIPMHIFFPTTTALPSFLRFLFMVLVNISYAASELEFCCYSVRVESTSHIIMDTYVMWQWLLESRWNVMAQGDAWKEKWRGNKRMEWVTSKRHMTAEHRLARAVHTLQADVHSSSASSRLNWRPRRFKWTCPFRRKTKSGFCACAITFQTQPTSN